MFTAALKQQDVVPNLAGNGFVVIGQSTSRMRVGEFAELLGLYRHSVQSVALSGRRSETGSGWKARWGDRAA